MEGKYLDVAEDEILKRWEGIRHSVEVEGLALTRRQEYSFETR